MAARGGAFAVSPASGYGSASGQPPTRSPATKAGGHARRTAAVPPLAVAAYAAPPRRPNYKPHKRCRPTAVIRDGLVQPSSCFALRGSRTLRARHFFPEELGRFGFVNVRMRNTGTNQFTAAAKHLTIAPMILASMSFVTANSATCPRPRIRSENAPFGPSKSAAVTRITLTATAIPARCLAVW